MGEEGAEKENVTRTQLYEKKFTFTTAVRYHDFKLPCVASCIHHFTRSQA